jgi:hypothetical protein
VSSSFFEQANFEQLIMSQEEHYLRKKSLTKLCNLAACLSKETNKVMNGNLKTLEFIYIYIMNSLVHKPLLAVFIDFLSQSNPKI